MDPQNHGLIKTNHWVGWLPGPLLFTLPTASVAVCWNARVPGKPGPLVHPAMLVCVFTVLMSSTWILRGFLLGSTWILLGFYLGAQGKAVVSSKKKKGGMPSPQLFTCKWLLKSASGICA